MSTMRQGSFEVLIQSDVHESTAIDITGSDETRIQ